ncbi:phage protein [soil metagenome]
MSINITTCNLALGELRAPPIADIAEDSLEARECARFYPHCLRLLLERHDWSFTNRRATLAELAVDDRASEWPHAYALPADCATPLRLVAPSAAGTIDFLVENRTLYTCLPDAVLEYAARDVTESEMSALFVDALAYTLAARLAVPIRDSREIKGQLLQQAEIALQRAVAEDRNRQPEHDGPNDEAVTRARLGAALTGQVR